jgi:hypothetical protein
VLLTFALGTAVGDLVDEQLGLGYWPTAVIVAVLIAAVTVSHLVFRANAVLTFWIAYVLTRPLGASVGDGLSQHRADGGLGLGTTVTSVVFLGDPRRGDPPGRHRAGPAPARGPRPRGAACWMTDGAQTADQVLVCGRRKSMVCGTK